MSNVDSHQSQSRTDDIIWSSNSITASSSSRALLCECDGLNYAVLAEHVVEVIELPNASGVVGAPNWFMGLAVYKARPVPVIDVGAYFNVGGSYAARPDTQQNTQQKNFQRRAIVVQLAGSRYLLAADKILNLTDLPAEDSATYTMPASSSNVPDLNEHRAIERICSVDNKQIALINLPELLRLTKFLRECQIV